MSENSLEKTLLLTLESYIETLELLSSEEVPSTVKSMIVLKALDNWKPILEEFKRRETE